VTGTCGPAEVEPGVRADRLPERGRGHPAGRRHHEHWVKRRMELRLEYVRRAAPFNVPLAVVDRPALRRGGPAASSKSHRAAMTKIRSVPEAIANCSADVRTTAAQPR